MKSTLRQSVDLNVYLLIWNMRTHLPYAHHHNIHYNVITKLQIELRNDNIIRVIGTSIKNEFHYNEFVKNL